MTRRSASPRGRSWSRPVAAAAATGLLAALVPIALQPAQAAPVNTCDRQNNNTYQKLLRCISAEGVMKHERAFQAIADANDDQYYPGSRAAGTDGLRRQRRLRRAPSSGGPAGRSRSTRST